MRRLLGLLRSIVAAAVSVAIVLAATGWLYLARPDSPLAGPRVRDALPLDELPRRDGVSVFLFLAVWIAAALLLGAVARWARAERLTAGLLLALGVGVWLYAVNGLSILIVRQIPAHQAFDAAAAEQAVVIPAVLAGAAGALLGRGGGGGGRAPPRRSSSAGASPPSGCSPSSTRPCRSTAAPSSPRSTPLTSTASRRGSWPRSGSPSWW